MESDNTINWHERFFQQALWTRVLRDYVLENIKLKQFSLVLEVGCGTGVILNEFSIKDSQRFGFDINESHLQTAKYYSHNAHYTMGDAHYLPYKQNSFDLVFCHFFLLWVENPLNILANMVQITKPGGYVVAFAEPDYGGRIDYPTDLEKIGDIQKDSLRLQGADPRLGRKLSSLLHQVGLSSVQTGIIGGQWSDKQDLNAWENEWRVIEYDFSFMSDPKPEINIDKLKEQDKKALLNRTRVLFVPTFYGWGRVDQ
jgi:SAM-dependent methyltransferase